jgi:tRNA threonylcarbamoyl adenosine modification protein YeaZ
MNILAFDTCLDKMYVALGNENEVLASKIIETTKEHYHSAFLISTIRDILKENDLIPSDINLIATNIGPGSFTGIRACTTVARVFAQGVNFEEKEGEFGVKGGIKAIGVSSLEILSRINQNSVMLSEAKHLKNKNEILRLMPQNDVPVLSQTLVALDARKEMAYVAIYDNKKEILAPKSILLEELKKIIAKNDYFLVTDDKLQPIIGGISYQVQDDDLGCYLIQIASEGVNSGTIETNWKKLLPLYIQPPAVNLKKVVK